VSTVDHTFSLDTGPFLAVLAVAAAAPLVADFATRAHGSIFVPTVTCEVLLGAAIGPDGFGLAHVTDVLDFFGQLGLGFLFFFAGYEIEFDRIRGAPIRLAALGWLLTIVLGYALAGALAAGGVVISGLLVGSAMSTTSLGTLIPILRDEKLMDTKLGRFIFAAGGVGELGPILIVTLLLGSQSDTPEEALLLFVFVLVALLAAAVASGAVGRSWNFIESRMDTSGQLPVRLMVLLLFALVVVAAELGLDIILGAAAAGVIVRLVLRHHEVERFESKLDAVGFGLLIPFFFITSGMEIDLDALFGSVGGLLKLPLFLGLFLLVRGLPALLLYRRQLNLRERGSLAFFSATELSLVVAITTIGLDEGHMHPSTAAALVGAGVLSTLLYPAMGLALARRRE
jgi:Kef-type K+ transport system membrane component KefB